jgi:hypothetical protein
VFQVNKSQENWPDAQLSLSTATPSLGGAPPKLTTLKINYYQPSYNRFSDYDRLAAESELCEKADHFCLQSAPLRESKKSKGFVSLRGRLSLNSKRIVEEDEEATSNTVNVLSTTTEASMSSSSFAIPRRSTIDADVSLFPFCGLSIFKDHSLIGQAT